MTKGWMTEVVAEGNTDTRPGFLAINKRLVISMEEIP